MMDSPWREELYSPSSACEIAEYEILEPELLQAEIQDLAQFTKDIAATPYDPEIWLNRAHCLRTLGFPELGLGDAYKARLLIEAALENTSQLGVDALKTFSTKIYELHMSNPAWERHVATPELLQGRAEAMLQGLEIQSWTELMEGLMASNCCNDYVQLSKEAVARFPDDDVFKSELENAKAWYQQRVDQLQARVDDGDLSKEQMDSTLLNGGVYPTPYPWMAEDVLERDATVLDSLRKEFDIVSSNCTVAKSTIRNTEGEEIADVLGVIALQDIKKGETVVLEKTLQGVVGDTSRCEACCGPISEAITNPCCNITYCSPQCSHRALTTFHPCLCGKDFSAFDTAAATATHTTDFSLDALLMIRHLALAFSVSPPTHPLQTTYLNRLTPSYGGPSARLLIFSFPEHIVTPITILQKIGIDPFANPDYETWVLQTIRCRLQNNKHGHTFDDRHGTAISTLYAMFNHSCDPNVDWRHDDESSTVTMFAERDIAKGEEMFISYIKKGMGRQERQATLMPWFGTECRCSRCEADTKTEKEESINGVSTAIDALKI